MLHENRILRDDKWEIVAVIKDFDSHQAYALVLNPL